MANRQDLPRPRTRQALVGHPRYYELRAQLLGFLGEYERGFRVGRKRKRTIALVKSFHREVGPWPEVKC